MDGERLNEKRKDRSLSQEETARLINISQRAYSHYETSTRDIPTDILKRLAILFNTSADYLLGLTDDEKPPEWSKRLPPELRRLREE